MAIVYQTLHDFFRSLGLEGYMLTFSEKFVKAHFSGEFFTLFPFLVHETTPVMQLNEAVARELPLARSKQILTTRPSAPTHK